MKTVKYYKLNDHITNLVWLGSTKDYLIKDKKVFNGAVEIGELAPLNDKAIEFFRRAGLETPPTTSEKIDILRGVYTHDQLVKIKKARLIDEAGLFADFKCKESILSSEVSIETLARVFKVDRKKAGKIKYLLDLLK